MPRWISWLAGPDPSSRVALKLLFIRLLILANLTGLTVYLTWRGGFTLNWALWPYSLALYLAEVYSFVDTSLFCLGMWNLRVRGDPPRAPENATVDVLITCFNEPVELVRASARAAREIDYPHKTWVLDDGDSSEMCAMAAAEGVGYIRRSETWRGKERHAKAGNLINALFQTEGQFLLILDADQVPRPAILDRTLGYFDDPRVAFVQTPQWFCNVPDGDPFGVAAPLFYGPIQQGKDGWNSAFFCGSNAVLRRESLMHAGVVSYARDLDHRVRQSLGRADGVLDRAASGLLLDATHARAGLAAVLGSVREARTSIGSGERLQEVTWQFQRRFEVVSRELVERDMLGIQADLARFPGNEGAVAPGRAAIEWLARGESCPFAAIPEVRGLLADMDVDRSDQAEPMLPLATISVTEDMATAMRLHAMGFKSVYHHEVLAVGLAPDDLRSVLQQRLRWAQGTMQVLFRENPIFQSGLSWPQRLMYFSTMWSYLSGFASVVYLLAPVLYLLFGWLPIKALSVQFLLFLLPCMVLNELLFGLIGHGMHTWRGRQYSLALFPLWINAVVTAVGNVYFGTKLGFVVTPKTRQGGAYWSLIRPQLAFMALLAFSSLYALVQLWLGLTEATLAVLLNVAWAVYNMVLLSVPPIAARWQPPSTPVSQS